MSEDSFTEVTSEGWFSRIGGAIKGVVVGIVIFAVGFPVLWLNEGRAVKTAKKINFAKENVVAISVDNVDRANEAKLVQLSGKVKTADTLLDSVFGLSVNAIKLIRSVEIYQWEETVESKTVKKLGGKKETKKTYTYSKQWSSHLTNSNSFKKQNFVNSEGKTISHQNPSQMKYTSSTQVAKNVKLGAFRLSDSLKNKISKASNCIANKIPTSFNDPIQLVNGHYFIGKDASTPMVGDLKVKFKTVDAQDVSVMARQSGDKLGAYQTPFGSYEQLISGTVGVESMIATAESSNSTLTWALRVLGLILMVIGLVMVFKPLSVVADVVPFIGSFVEMGTGILAFLISITCASLTIGIAWIFYRPLIGIPMVLISIGSIVMIIKKRKENATT